MARVIPAGIGRRNAGKGVPELYAMDRKWMIIITYTRRSYSPVQGIVTPIIQRGGPLRSSPCSAVVGRRLARDAGGAGVVGHPVGAPQVAHGDADAVVGGVDDLAVTRIDGDVRNARAIGVGKVDQVTGLQLAAANVRAGRNLAAHGAAQADARLVEHIVDKAAAIEAGGAGAAVAVGVAHILHRHADHATGAAAPGAPPGGPPGRAGAPRRG